VARSVSAKRKQQQQRAGALLLVVALVLGASVFGLYIWKKGQQVKADPITLCPVDSPRGITVLLIDRTEPLNLIQKEDLRQHLARLRDTLPLYSAIEVYSIGPTASGVLKPEAPRICNPGRGQGLSPLVANPALVERQWQSLFAVPLERILDQLLKDGEQPTSPILESIQSVALTAFAPLPTELRPRRLIVASDMLQNTPELSHYDQVIPLSQLGTTSYYHRVRATLTDVEVEILYVRRDTGRQGAAHIQFWQDYFADSGARLTHVIKLAG